MPVVPANHPTSRLLPSHWAADSASVLLLVALMLLIAAPLGRALQLAPEALWSPEHWRAFLAEPATGSMILQSLAIALLATGLASLIALPLALIAAQANTFGRRLLLIVGTTPLLVPSSIWVILVEDLFSHLPPVLSGDLMHRPSTLLITTYAIHLSPIMLLVLTAYLLRADHAQAESARCHGISDFGAWYRMTLPQLIPAFVLAGTVIGLRVLSDLGAPNTLGVERLLVVQASNASLAEPASLADMQAALILLLICASLVVLSWRHLVAPTQAAIPMPPPVPRSWPALLVALTLVLLVIAALLPIAGHSGALQLSESDITTWQRLLPTAAATSLVLIVLGLPAALLARHRGGAARMLRWALPLALVIPTPLLAEMLLRLPGLGTLPASTGSPWPVVLATGAAIALPVLALVPHLSAHLALLPNNRQRELAYCYGGSGLRPIARLILPAQLFVLVALLLIGAALGLNAEGTGETVAQRLAIGISDDPLHAATIAWPVDAWLLLATTAGLALGAGLALRRRRWSDATPVGRKVES